MGAAYSGLVARHPIKTQSATAGIIGGIGDLLMQNYERFQSKSSGEIDLKRTGRLAFYRGVLLGPAYVLWLRGLDRFVISGSELRVMASKTFLDQFVFTPPKMIYFYTTMAMMEGYTLQGALERAMPKIWPTLQVNWPLWCCIQSITFSVIPTQYRVAFIGVADTLWNAWLSRMNAKEVCKESNTSTTVSLFPMTEVAYSLANVEGDAN